MSYKSPNHTNLCAEMAAALRDLGEPPTILGGQFAHNRLTAFLRYWGLDKGAMKWRIWELTNALTFDADIGDTQHLQRAEIFGEEGHLSLRRDGQKWLWHFIGLVTRDPSSSFPENQSEVFLSGFISNLTAQPTGEGDNEEFACEDYWMSEETRRASDNMRRYEESVILWGEKRQSDALWWDDRVAAAILRYPVINKGNARVKLEFWRYTQAGRTAFVWYRQLSPIESAASHGDY